MKRINYEKIAEKARKYLELARNIDFRIMYVQALRITEDRSYSRTRELKLDEAIQRCLNGFSRQIKLLPKNHHAFEEIVDFYNTKVR